MHSNKNLNKSGTQQICSLPWCRQTGAHLTFQNFPDNEIRQGQWLTLLDVAETWKDVPPDKLKEYRICSLHFDSRGNLIRASATRLITAVQAAEATSSILFPNQSLTSETQGHSLVSGGTAGKKFPGLNKIKGMAAGKSATSPERSSSSVKTNNIGRNPNSYESLIQSLFPEENGINQEKSDMNNGTSDVSRKRKPAFALHVGPQTRKSFSLAKKMEILRMLQSGMRQSDVSKLTNLPSSTVWSIWNSRVKIESAFMSSGSWRKKLRRSTFEEVDNALFKWYNSVASQNVSVTGRLLQTMAESYAQELGKTDFVCTAGWLERFKQRYGISLLSHARTQKGMKKRNYNKNKDYNIKTEDCKTKTEDNNNKNNAASTEDYMSDLLDFEEPVELPLQLKLEIDVNNDVECNFTNSSPEVSPSHNEVSSITSTDVNSCDEMILGDTPEIDDPLQTATDILKADQRPLQMVASSTKANPTILKSWSWTYSKEPINPKTPQSSTSNSTLTDESSEDNAKSAQAADWLQHTWPKLRTLNNYNNNNANDSQEYAPQDIFSAEEIGILYRLSPSDCGKITNRNNKKNQSPPFDISQERLAVILCANSDGSEKRRLLVATHIKNPPCITSVIGRDFSRLPADYQYTSDPSSWVTRQNLIQYLESWDASLMGSERKVLLVLSDSLLHEGLPKFHCINIILVPPHIASELLPLQLGIVKEFRHRYRRLQLERMITYEQNSVSRIIPILDAIMMLSTAWTEISKEAMTSVFSQAGILSGSTIVPGETKNCAPYKFQEFDVNGLREKAALEGFLIPTDWELENFFNIDDCLFAIDCTPENGICDEDKAPSPSEPNADNSVDPNPACSISASKIQGYLDLVKMWAMSRKTVCPQEIHNCLSKVESFVRDH